MICPNCKTVFVFAVPEDQPKVEKPTCPACAQKSDFERSLAKLVDATSEEVERLLAKLVDATSEEVERHLDLWVALEDLIVEARNLRSRSKTR